MWLSPSSCDTLVLYWRVKGRKVLWKCNSFYSVNREKKRRLLSFICWIVWPWGSFHVGWNTLILGTVSEHRAQRDRECYPTPCAPSPLSPSLSLSLTPTLGQVPTCPSGVLLLTWSQDDYVLITPAEEREGEWEESSRLAPRACRLPRPQHCTNESRGSGWAHTGGQGLLPRAKGSQGARPKEELAAGDSRRWPVLLQLRVCKMRYCCVKKGLTGSPQNDCLLLRGKHQRSR